MLHASSSHESHFIKKKPLTFLVNIFKRKKESDESNDSSDTTFEEDFLRDSETGHDFTGFVDSGRMVRSCPSPLTLDEVDIVVPKPSVSGVVTPGRVRDLEQDMEALRLSRQDNPFLQVLASQECLLDTDEGESDGKTLVSQESLFQSQSDPFSLTEIHEHLIRSPPPTSWPRSPGRRIFTFPSPEHAQENQTLGFKPLQTNNVQGDGRNNGHEPSVSDLVSPGSSNSRLNTMSARLNITPRPHRKCSPEYRERGSFSVLSPSLLGGRTHMDSRRLHHGSDDGTALLVGSANDDQVHHCHMITNRKCS